MNEHNNQSSLVKPEELKAFSAVLKQQGCQESDFQARAISQKKEGQYFAKKEAPQQNASRMENNPAQHAQKSCQVAVKNQKTGKEKIYQAGEGHHWVKDFEIDLKNQKFK